MTGSDFNKEAVLAVTEEMNQEVATHGEVLVEIRARLLAERDKLEQKL